MQQEDGGTEEHTILKSRCSFFFTSGASDSLLHLAAYHKKEHIAALICDHFPKLLIRRNVRGDTPLNVVAVRSKNSTIVKLILSQYAIEKTKHDD
ncbi:hypothetical protein glysoja_042327 [Glycine soja]|uniref:Uncharacterized protein n=1 Tax=Glycine soja TaxID=3848 RepID=A0A0B2RTZ6_GLYSO|nr:hypothetical protein glysoja_042327 [Glycine soja]